MQLHYSQKDSGVFRHQLRAKEPTPHLAAVSESISKKMVTSSSAEVEKFLGAAAAFSWPAWGASVIPASGQTLLRAPRPQSASKGSPINSELILPLPNFVQPMVAGYSHSLSYPLMASDFQNLLFSIFSSYFLCFLVLCLLLSTIQPSWNW